MFPALYQYLLTNKILPVPGIGTFHLERTPAVSDFPNRCIHAPGYAIVMEQGSQVPDKYFFRWLATATQCSDREAIFRFNDFSFDLKKQLAAGAIIEWTGVGQLSSGLGGEIKFIPAPVFQEQPVKAEKVLRQHAAHTIRVGEDERSSAEMTALLTQESPRRNLWWITAAAIGLFGFIFVGWYLSEHGIEPTSVGNNSPLVPAVSPDTTYSVLP